MKHIPNILTIIRMCLIPVFVMFFFSDSPNGQSYALLIFLIAGITDVLDGQIARRYNLVSAIGTVLDPLADKLMLLTALICLALVGILPVWALVIVYLKEFFMIISGSLLFFRREKFVIPANQFGKLATVSFTLAVILLILLPNSPFSFAALLAAIALKFVALFSYVFGYLKFHRKNKNPMKN